MYQKKPVVDATWSLTGIVFATLFPHFGFIPVPFGYTVPVLLVLWLLLKRTEERFSDIGFSFQNFEWKALRIGALAAVLLFVFLNSLFFPLLAKVTGLQKANLDDFKFIRHHTLNYLFVLLMAWVVGGFYEELVFHGYIFTRLEKLVSGKQAIAVSFLLSNLIFGFYHIQLGVSGMLNAFLAGCAYHALLLRFHRNLWYALACHAFYDTIGLTFIYLGWW